jgi:hypothetical protein
MSDLFKANNRVFLIPTGNNVHRRQAISEQVLAATITLMKRVKGSLVVDGHANSKDFSRHNFLENLVSTGTNAGYMVFESLKDIENYFLAEKTKAFIRNNDISNDNLLKIAELLGLEDNDITPRS